VEEISESGKQLKLILSEEVTFLNKGSVRDVLTDIPSNSTLIIDGSSCKQIDYDVLELIQDFKNYTAKEKNIRLETINIPGVIVMGH